VVKEKCSVSVASVYNLCTLFCVSYLKILLLLEFFAYHLNSKVKDLTETTPQSSHW